MYLCNPSEGERFYLRLLLLHVKGACGYQDLLTFNGTVFNSFKEAAKGADGQCIVLFNYR